MDLNHGIKNSPQKVLLLSKKLSNKFSSSFRFIAKPLGMVSWLVGCLRTELWIITGEEINSKEKLTMSYAGTEDQKKFFVKMVFGDSFVEKYVGKIWVWNYCKTVKQGGYNCALMVNEVLKYYRNLFARKNCFYLPAWLDGGVDSCTNLTRSAKSDIQKFKKNKMHFEVTDELAKFDHFYYNMHVPYIKNTYGDLALIFSYDYMKNKFGKQGLYNALFVLKTEDNEDVAAVLVGYQKDGLYLHFLGVKDGNCDLVKDGVIGALFSYPILYSKEQGYRWVNYGLSRPFLKDGALNFKRKRGMQITGIDEKGFVVRPLSKSIAVKKFFLNNPFIYKNNNTLKCAVFLDDDQSLSTEDFIRLYNEHYLEGISKIVIYSFGNPDNKLKENTPNELSDKFAIQPADCLF